MRTMIKCKIPVERGNQAVADGTLAKTFETLFEKLKPEAAYFYPEHGYRAAMMVFEMKDSSETAQIAELLFSKLDASFHITPVMNGDDLKKGLASAKW